MNYSLAQSAGDIKYTDCISAEGLDSSPDSKESDGKDLVILEL